MKYFSIVVNIGDAFPYDKQEKTEDRFFTWVGEFVKPIADLGLHDKLWFFYYEDHAKLRIWMDEEKYSKLEPVIQSRLTPPLSLRLDSNGQIAEQSYSLDGDLGMNRLHPPDFSPKQIHERALLVLGFLHSTCELVLDSIRKSPEGYWVLEPNENRQENHFGSPFESLHHFFCQITKVNTAFFECLIDGKLVVDTWFATQTLNHQANPNQPPHYLYPPHRIYF